MTQRRPDVTAVMVTYESRDTVGQSLDALRVAYDARVTDVIVVDNASSDGTADFISEHYRWVTLVRSRHNLGYGRGCNLGWRHASTPYIMFMNADAVLTLHAIEVMRTFMERNPRAGIVAPAIRCMSGEYQEAGGLPTPMTQLREATGVRRWQRRSHQVIQPGGEPFTTDWLCGAVLFTRSHIMRELRGFDPRFFLYFEETDLCIRAQAAGYELWAIGEAVATHASNTSARKIDPTLADEGCLSQHYYQSRYYYLTKHYGIMAATCAEVGELMLKGIRDLARLLAGRGGADKCRRRLRGPILMFPRALVNNDEIAQQRRA
jgi:N-acetylglucosaminyl-diphospho-decaprenol L-rhamnosyltransferase